MLKQLKRDVEAAYAHGPTKRLLAHLVDGSGLLSAAGSTPHAEGRRWAGLEIKAVLEAHIGPAAFFDLMRDVLNAQLKLLPADDSPVDETEGNA